MRMRITCWINKVTNTYSQYVIHTALSLQQLLQERVLLLCYTYTVHQFSSARPTDFTLQGLVSLIFLDDQLEHVCNPQPARMCYATCCHTCKLCIYSTNCTITQAIV